MKKIPLPAGCSDLAARFDRPIYIVGGYVRDALLDYEPHDVDLTGDVDPADFFSIADDRFIVKETSKKLMTLKVIDNRTKTEYEFTSFRVDSYSAGKHSPDVVKRTDNIVADALRRDFCANAVYYDVKDELLVDPLGGINDIKNKVLRQTRESTFCEDGLRLMRLCRQAAETGFSIDPDTKEAAKRNVDAIRDITPERIREELDRILVADTRYGIKNGHYRGLKLLDEMGILDIILPEITLGRGMFQRPDYHKYDVLGHICHTVLHADPSVRLAALFHDCAKPYCKVKNDNYKNHDVEGERIADEVLHRLRYSNDEIWETKELTRWHMYDLNCEAKENTVRVFLQEHRKIVDKLLLLKQADYLGGGLHTDTAPGVIKMKGIYEKMLQEGVPFSVKDLLIDGHDLEQLHIPENRRSEVLKSLLRECAYADSPYRDREKQLEYLKRTQERE